MTEVLRVQNLIKTYRSYKGYKGVKELRAVDDVSFTVSKREIVGFLGPNGAGKSTTIKMIAGLARATSGSVSICGFDIVKDHVKAMERVGGVIETPDMYEDRTAWQNLTYYASLEAPERLKNDASEVRPIKDIITERVEGVLRLVRLYERRDDKVKTFSMGMKQRLGIAQALLAKPDLLVLDEPANGLDPEGIKEVRDLLRTLADEFGMAILVSSHQLAEMQMMCDRALIISEGKIVGERDISELNVGADGAVTIVVKVDRPLDACAYLKEKTGLNCEATETSVKIHGGAESYVITKELVIGGFNVSGVSEETVNLEDYFMSAVRGAKHVGVGQTVSDGCNDVNSEEAPHQETREGGDGDVC